MGQYTQQDPIGLAGGMPTLYGYVGNPNFWVDVFGLTGLNESGFTVYGLFNPGETTPYYVGITNDFSRRQTEHSGSRLIGNQRMQHLETENLLYGQARGYEQAYIENYGTRNGIIGQDISPTNQGNKYNSFDHNRADPNRKPEDTRGQAFESAFNEKDEELKKKKGLKDCR